VNRPLRRVAALVLLLFGALIVNVNYLQAVKARSLRDKPGNTRTIYAEYDHERGSLLVGGAEVAKSVATKDRLKYLRTYPRGPQYAPATGFYSVVYGASGIEQYDNAVLAGNDSRLFVRQIANLVTGEKRRGGSVRLTLDPRAQRAAWKDLRSKKGAAVALDPRTGAILALVTAPSYDPTQLSSHDTKAVNAEWRRLQADPNQPLLDRATSSLYPPGSTFKLVTAAAALSSGRYTKDTVIPAPTRLRLPGTTRDLTNENGDACGSGRVPLEEALRLSCNTAYGGLGIKLGADALREQADKFGFGADLGIPMPVAPSVFPADPDPAQTALSAIGQFDVKASPLQMAMVAGGIGNGGVVMRPHIVQELLGPDLAALETAQPEQLSTAVTPDVARQLTAMMVTVVRSGTGTSAQIPGIDVAGKTGTAQHGTGTRPHAWFVAFAPAQHPTVAVAVVVEDASTNAADISGFRYAAPIAKDIMQAVLP